MGILLSVLLFLICNGDASAATRKVFFSQSVTNFTTTTNGEGYASTCTITISNPSSTIQTFTMVPNMLADGAAVVSFACTGGGSTAAACYQNISLVANTGTHTITWTFPTVGSAAIVTQSVVCSGTITVLDATATAPGFVFANGSILNFLESGAAKVLTGQGGAGNANARIKGSVVFSQSPITIGEGRPF